MTDKSFRQKYVLILIVLNLILLSCKSLSEIGKNTFSNNIITKENYSELNGVYSNLNDTIIGEYYHGPADGYSDENLLKSQTLTQHLHIKIPKKNQIEFFEVRNEVKVKIEFQDSKSALISIYYSDKFLFSDKIHGHIKNGFFYLRPNFCIIPLFPLIFFYDYQTSRIGKHDDFLITNYKTNMWGAAFIAGSTEKGHSTALFIKKTK